MTKSELIRAIATESGVPQTKTSAVLEALATVLKNTMRDADSVKERIILPGIGIVKIKEVKAREGDSAFTGHWSNPAYEKVYIDTNSELALIRK